MNTHFKILALIIICVGCGAVEVGKQPESAYSSDSGTETCSGVAATFATDVTPIFSASGTSCVASGCHASGESFSLDVATDGAAAVYTNATSSGRVNTTIPRDSKMLRKPLGLDGHPKILSSIFNTDYLTIFCWIAAGTPDN